MSILSFTSFRSDCSFLNATVHLRSFKIFDNQDERVDWASWHFVLQSLLYETLFIAHELKSSRSAAWREWVTANQRISSSSRLRLRQKLLFLRLMKATKCSSTHSLHTWVHWRRADSWFWASSFIIALISVIRSDLWWFF